MGSSNIVSGRNLRALTRAVRRVLACVATVLPFLPAAADQIAGQPAFALLAHADISRHQSLADQMESAASTQVMRAGYSTLSLAELGEQPRRTEALAAGALAVVYPDIGEPYRSIFAKIIEGIEGNARNAVRNYPIGPNVEPADLGVQLKRNGTKVVIALGRQGLKATAGLDIPVIAGGVMALPEAENRIVNGISLTPDPALLFGRLKGLLPNVKRVLVVYDPRHNDWLIRIAREAAKAQGLELVAYDAHDLGNAARLYETAFASSDGRRDALWLPQDATTVDETTILPLVLKESWDRNVPVFSSSFLHVKKGALFSLYPDNVELGRTLASSALAAAAGETRRHGVLPLREVHTAVNLRTASHIGLNISYQQQRSFDFVFPEP